MAKRKMQTDTESKPLYIVLLSIHGLIRGEELELGRDADTGGQTKYVVELARALAERDDVAQVDLFTRRVVDSHVSSDYGRPIEQLSERARIVRIDAGPEGYIYKEQLWDHLDTFADSAVGFLREAGGHPNVIHSHYADAGYVGLRMANLLGVPLVHTGHSLGRVKRRRLLASGLSRDEIEAKYHMSRRIEAEEETLGVADLIITSTKQEIDEQYGLYDHYLPDHMRVIPPGTDLNRFFPPKGNEGRKPIARELKRFLRDPKKPIILALSRPDERKNISTLIETYGENQDLQDFANLVIVAGNRDDIADLESGPQGVLTEILLLIDAYDLYGKVAYPKHHSADDVPILYRLAAASKGVFVNPALTEPFGLTLIEAAASSLPMVATEDGGPRDILDHCHNGVLVDPLDKDQIGQSLLNILSNALQWDEMAANGLKGVHQNYSWHAHAEIYMHTLHRLVAGVEVPQRAPAPGRRPMLYHDRAIFTDLDQNLLGDPQSLAEFIKLLHANRRCATFGIATGRTLESSLKIMRRYGIPQPDVLITNVGTEIYYAPQLTADTAWSQHIDHSWNPRKIRRLLRELPGISIQASAEQSRYKISFFMDPNEAPPMEEITRLLHQKELSVNTFLSFGQFLDIVPVRASKGFALRWFADQWGIPIEHILAAGGSGTDEDMLRGNTLGVVVANRHHEELSHLVDIESIYFSEASFAQGIIEAIEHYDFYGSCQLQPPGKIEQ